MKQGNVDTNREFHDNKKLLKRCDNNVEIMFRKKNLTPETNITPSEIK